MKPKYQINREITELSKWSLPPIYPDQIQWGYDHCLDKLAHLSRGKMYCLECGSSWKPENNRKIQVCPDCSTKLKMETDYRSYRSDTAYMAVVTTCEGYQVVRMIWIRKILKMNSPASYFGKEVMQHWIDERGNCIATMSLTVNGLSQACDSWIFSSEMKIKESRGGYNTEYRHNLSPYKSFPKAQILPIFERNGFKGDFHWISPIRFFHQLLIDQRFETLLKAKQYSLLKFNGTDGIGYRLWNSVKICIRNNYIVKDAKMWKDYLDLLEYFKKDLRNAHYVCPKDLKQAHDLLMNKKREIQKKEQLIIDRERELKRIEKAKKDIENYAVQKSNFFGILITDGKIKIKPLESVEEFKIEGDTLEHCVYTNAYYNFKDSLILSARIDNKPIETIEVNLKSFEVVQSRGLKNDPTEYHDQIIKLVRKNIKVIQEKKSVKHQKISV